MRLKRCNADGCGVDVAKTEVFCVWHKALLPDDTRVAISAQFRPGRLNQSKRFRVAFDKALLEIAFAVRVGQRAPRDQPVPLEPEERTL